MKNIISILIVLLAGIVLAQTRTISKECSDKLIVGTGPADGTYAKMFQDLGKATAKTKVFICQFSTAGTIENVELLAANTVNMALVQEDAMFNARDLEGDDSIKRYSTLLVLHPESMHFIVQKTGETTRYTSFTQLNGKRVGVVKGSGSVGTLGLLSYFLDSLKIKLTKYECPDRQTCLDMLKAGQLDAFLAVGGTPVKWIAELDGSLYGLLPMDAINKEIFKTPGGYVYTTQKVRYSNLQSGVVATYATKALLVARNFKDPAKIQQLTVFRDAALKAIPTLPDQAGTHPQWTNVLPGTKSAWPMWTGK